MRHDPRLADPLAHPGWCECRVCAPRKAALAADLADTWRCVLAGLVTAVPLGAAIVLLDRCWPAIAAWWSAL